MAPPEVNSFGKQAPVRGRLPTGSGVSPAISKPNFYKLDISSLRKYRRFFNLDVSPTASKEQLVSAVTRHFKEYVVEEVKTIQRFIENARRRKMNGAKKSIVAPGR